MIFRKLDNGHYTVPRFSDPAKVEAEAAGKSFDIECPQCFAVIQVHVGKNTCPYCNDEINVGLDIDTWKSS